MAVASFQAPAIVYREEQSFAWWAYALLGLVELGIILGFYAFDGSWFSLARASQLRALAFATFALSMLSVPILVAIGLLRMTTVVTPGDIRVWFGWIPTYRRMIPTGFVRRAEVIQFRPLADHGGWGIRGGRDGERVLTARGNRGVRVELTDGSLLLIGSQRPEELAKVIDRAAHPAG